MPRLKKNIWLRYALLLVFGIGIGFRYHDEINYFITEDFASINYKDLASRQKLETSYLREGKEVGKKAREERYISEISLCFTPPEDCALAIIKEINKAKSSIYLQAYGFTHSEIINALILASYRGVEVRGLLDKSNLQQRHSGISQLQQAGIETTIDMVPGIAHNKVMIIDEVTTITGSFNFTKSANSRNAENVVIIEDKNIAKEYLRNWLYRKARSKKVAR